MISRKPNKKVKSKKTTKRTPKKVGRRNPDRHSSAMGTMASPRWHSNDSIDKLYALLDKRGDKAAAQMTGTSFHYTGISDNIERDIEFQQLDENPSKSDLLKYLREKKEVLEGVITDFIRLG